MYNQKWLTSIEKLTGFIKYLYTAGLQVSLSFTIVVEGEIKGCHRSAKL
jgi:hypothetical protein